MNYMVFCKNDIEPYFISAESPSEALEKCLREQGFAKEKFSLEIEKVDKYNAAYCVVNTNKRIKNYYKAHANLISFSLYVYRGMPPMKIIHKQTQFPTLTNVVKDLGITDSSRDFIIQSITPTTDKVRFHILPNPEIKGIIIIQNSKIVSKLDFKANQTGDIIIGFEKAYTKYKKVAALRPSIKDLGCLIFRVRDGYVELDLDKSDGFIQCETAELLISKEVE